MRIKWEIDNSKMGDVNKMTNMEELYGNAMEYEEYQIN